jgi:hypothetical protein
VRIAAPRLANLQDATGPSVSDAKAVGASFFDALACASAKTSSEVAAGPSPTLRNAGAGPAQSGRAEITTDAEAQAGAQQAAIREAGQRPSVAAVCASQPQLVASGSGISDATNRSKWSSRAESQTQRHSNSDSENNTVATAELSTKVTPTLVLTVPSPNAIEIVSNNPGTGNAESGEAVDVVKSETGATNHGACAQFGSTNSSCALGTSFSAPALPLSIASTTAAPLYGFGASVQPAAPVQVLAADREPGNIPTNEVASQQPVTAGHAEANSQSRTSAAPAKTAGSTDAATSGNSAPAAGTDASQPTGAVGIAIAAGNTPVAIPLGQFVLAGVNILPGFSGTAPQSNNTTLNGKTGDSTIAKTGGAASLTGISAGGQAPSTATSAANSAHVALSGTQGGTQNNGSGSQTAQPAQPGAAQAATIAAKPIDTGAAPVPTVAAHAPSREAADSHSNTAGAGDTMHADDQMTHAEAADAPASLGINTARVIQKMSETEMHVGMNSAEFGEISIRTSVSQQQMTTQIAVDHGDLGKAISAHIPAMQQKLGDELGLRATVEVNQGGMSYSTERDQSSPKQQRTMAAVKLIDGTDSATEATYTATPAVVAAGDGYRLDIRA